VRLTGGPQPHLLSARTSTEDLRSDDENTHIAIAMPAIYAADVQSQMQRRRPASGRRVKPHSPRLVDPDVRPMEATDDSMIGEDDPTLPTDVQEPRGFQRAKK
jgi:hypothetical protein